MHAILRRSPPRRSRSPEDPSPAFRPPIALGFRALLPGIALLGALFGAAASAQSLAFNVERLDQLPLGLPETVTDVDIDGNLAFVGRGPLGLSIVDVSNAGDMEVVGQFNLPGQLIVNDVQAAGGRAYVTNEGMNGVAVYILDVTVPQSPAVIGAIIQPVLNLAHNLFIDGDILYVIGHEGVVGWRTRIFNVANPADPVQLAVLTSVGAHDITVLDGILYEAGGWSGLHLWDVSDPANPVHLAEADTNDGPRPHYHTHSMWPTEDRRHILTMNELTSNGPGQIQAGGLKVWAWDGQGQLEQVADWRPEVAQGSTILTIHNAVVRGNHAYLSYYQAGIRVLDLQDPANPVEVGFFDTYPAPPLVLWEGCWGVDLSPESDPEPRVYASDRTHGLFQLAFNGSRRVRLHGAVVEADNGAPIPNASVHLVTAGRHLTADAAGQFEVLTGEGEHQILVSAPGYFPSRFEVTLNAEIEGGPVIVKLFSDIIPTWAPAHSATVRLEPNQPNPFQGATIIPFEVDLSGRQAGVRLSVHDAGGRTVRVLFDQTAEPGRHEVPWDGRDARGVLVPNGVYYFRLSAGDQVHSGSMQLIR